MTQPHRCFVKSLAQVSCQQPLADEWLHTPLTYPGQTYVRAVEPDTKGVIAPADARRMSRILKRSVCTALHALKDAAVTVPDAIITGTGMGCIENSEKFLADLTRFGESCLKPTLFMQSTHNTISSLVAIMLKCHGYNNTYSHKGISFESALLDARLQLLDGTISSVLAGAHDEVTPLMARVMEHSHPEYAMVSETSMSAVLSSDPRGALCELTDVRLLHRPDPHALAAMLSAGTDSLLMLGTNGNPANDAPYSELLATLGFTPVTLRYRHLFGDNFSAPAMSFYAAARMLHHGTVPGFMRADGSADAINAPESITILNHSDGDWSLIRLTRN